MIEAAIFDMDGLLIDSEPFWVESEKKVFSSIGIELTDVMCFGTFGMRIQEVVPHWYRYKPWDKSKKSFESVQKEILENVIKLIYDKGKLFEGTENVIKLFKDRKIKTALASSSPVQIIDAVLDRFGARKYFEVIRSAEFEEYGKPHPAIWITTAKALGAEPESCAAFEDSLNGLISAKAAKMKAVVIPDKRLYNDTRFDIADIKLRSLKEFNSELLDRLNNI